MTTKSFERVASGPAPADLRSAEHAEHPADADQGRGMDPAFHRRGLFAPVVDGAAYCVIRLIDALKADEESARPVKLLQPKPLPDLDRQEARSWFNGWWHGICVGAVIGIGLAALFFTSGVLS